MSNGGRLGEIATTGNPKGKTSETSESKRGLVGMTFGWPSPQLRRFKRIDSIGLVVFVVGSTYDIYASKM